MTKIEASIIYAMETFVKLGEPKFNRVVEALSEFVLDYKDETGKAERLEFHEVTKELITFLNGEAKWVSKEGKLCCSKCGVSVDRLPDLPLTPVYENYPNCHAKMNFLESL